MHETSSGREGADGNASSLICTDRVLIAPSRSKCRLILSATRVFSSFLREPSTLMVRRQRDTKPTNSWEDLRNIHFCHRPSTVLANHSSSFREGFTESGFDPKVFLRCVGSAWLENFPSHRKTQAGDDPPVRRCIHRIKTRGIEVFMHRLPRGVAGNVAGDQN